VDSLKGKLILDGGLLADSEFARTVVLICWHDQEGAFGLVLNRPSEHKVGESLSVNLPEALALQRLYIGGPVQPQLLSLLVYDPAAAVNDLKTDDRPMVAPGLRLASSIEEILEFGCGTSPSSRVLFFAGYAGWASGQLDNEMKAGAWLTHPSSTDLIFTPEPQVLWKQILRTKGPEYRLVAETPDDISLN
jgi:putative transcriptional regulator